MPRGRNGTAPARTNGADRPADLLYPQLACTIAEELVRVREPASYTEAEQGFSQFVQAKLHRLLRGEDNCFTLMRRYAGPQGQISFFMPSRLRREGFRPEVAEELITSVLRFLNPYAPGGPVAQEQTRELLLETQTFPTQYPHIVIERVDAYAPDGAELRYTEWQIVRLQNQRRSTMVNRALDFGNLAFEIARILR